MAVDSLAHGTDTVNEGLNRRAAIEDVHHAIEVKAFRLQHFQRRLGVFMHTANNRPCSVRQHGQINGVLGHQLGNERFIAKA